MPTIVEIKKNLEDFFNILDIAPEVRKIWYDEINTYENNGTIDALISLTTEHYSDFERFYNAMHSLNSGASTHYINEETVLMFFHPTDFSMVRVFPNFTISTNQLSSLKNISILDIDEVFNTFHTEYKEDMKDERKKEKWIPEERGIKRLNQYLDLNIATALSRYTCLPKYLKDSQIRDLATALDNYRRPMKIIYAETPEQFVDMYGSGPQSCMDFRFNESWPELVKNNLCPPSFYAHFELTKGAYLKVGDKVVARCILFKDLKNDKWLIGRMYTSNTEYANKFKNSLIEEGIKTNAPTMYEPPAGHVTVIPGTKMSGKENRYCMPWPYFDNMEYHGKGFTCEFDIEKNNFILTFGNIDNKKDTVTVKGRQGMLISTDYIVQKHKCPHCNNHFIFNEGLPTVEGIVFCSTACAKVNDFINVITIDGNHKWQKNDEYMITISGLDSKFPSMAAANRNGYYLKYQGDNSYPEETDCHVEYGNRIKDRIGEEYCTSVIEYQYDNGYFPFVILPAVKSIKLEY